MILATEIARITLTVFKVSYNMRPAIEFSAKHNIKPHLTFFKLEQLPEMVEIMHAGKTKGRLGIKFE
jgi:propanol-preferring alcohol dehydrogenase